MASPTRASIYLQRTYLAESLDPIHIGTGEFQLGRVDNTIVREPGTNLPKIPGSSLAGVARAYAAMAASKYLTKGENGDRNTCAGKGGDFGEKHCGGESCPVCTAFGFSKGKSNQSFQGLVQFSDARILFFPVYSATGPLWVTCPASLEAAGITDSAGQSLTGLFRDLNDQAALFSPGQAPVGKPDWLNLGWLYLPQFTGTVPPADSWKIVRGGPASDLIGIRYAGQVLSRLAVVSDRRFSSIVDDQLEVRTSVSINPETGAAQDGALFTAEAIPRACFLFMNVTYLNPGNFLIPPGKQIRFGDRAATTADMVAIAEEALSLVEYLGIGGVNTRGMGRLRVIA